MGKRGVKPFRRKSLRIILYVRCEGVKILCKRSLGRSRNDPVARPIPPNLIDALLLGHQKHEDLMGETAC